MRIPDHPTEIRARLKARLARLGSDQPLLAASLAQIDGMYAHLEEALVAIGFLDADNPRKLMPRLKRMFARTQLETEEVNILRGIARKIMAQRDIPR